MFRKKKGMDPARAKDLDETRRLLYMVLLYNRTKSYELVATLLNSLKHHQRVDMETDELRDRLIAFVDNSADDPWLREQIEQLTVQTG